MTTRKKIINNLKFVILNTKDINKLFNITELKKLTGHFEETIMNNLPKAISQIKENYDIYENAKKEVKKNTQ